MSLPHLHHASPPFTLFVLHLHCASPLSTLSLSPIYTVSLPHLHCACPPSTLCLSPVYTMPLPGKPTSSFLLTITLTWVFTSLTAPSHQGSLKIAVATLESFWQEREYSFERYFRTISEEILQRRLLVLFLYQREHFVLHRVMPPPFQSLGISDCWPFNVWVDKTVKCTGVISNPSCMPLSFNIYVKILSYIETYCPLSVEQT